MASANSYFPELIALQTGDETFSPPVADESTGERRLGRNPADIAIASARQRSTLPADATASLDQTDEERTVTITQEVGPPPRRLFSVLQKWEGTVLRVGVREFDASLRDMTEPANPMEQATFSIDEVSPSDTELLERGAVFYWAVGYETYAGQRSRKSIIRFRHLPRWTSKDIGRVNDRVRMLEDALGADH
jgi:hypothetical protein